MAYDKTKRYQAVKYGVEWAIRDHQERVTLRYTTTDRQRCRRIVKAMNAMDDLPAVQAFQDSVSLIDYADATGSEIRRLMYPAYTRRTFKDDPDTR